MPDHWVSAAESTPVLGVVGNAQYAGLESKSRARALQEDALPSAKLVDSLLLAVVSVCPLSATV